MIKRILSVSGKPGLYKLVSQGKNMLIVEALATGKRMPVYARDKVISLGDISIYTTEGDEPLAEVMQKVADKNEAKVVDVKAFESDSSLRDYFETILPAFDKDRVYTTDIKKLFAWYNLLIEAGITQFVEKPEEEEAPKQEEEK